jgi:hypothetical protein
VRVPRRVFTHAAVRRPGAHATATPHLRVISELVRTRRPRFARKFLGGLVCAHHAEPSFSRLSDEPERARPRRLAGVASVSSGSLEGDSSLARHQRARARASTTLSPECSSARSCTLEDDSSHAGSSAALVRARARLLVRRLIGALVHARGRLLARRLIGALVRARARLLARRLIGALVRARARLLTRVPSATSPARDHDSAPRLRAHARQTLRPRRCPAHTACELHRRVARAPARDAASARVEPGRAPTPEFARQTRTRDAASSLAKHPSTSSLRSRAARGLVRVRPRGGLARSTTPLAVAGAPPPMRERAAPASWRGLARSVRLVTPPSTTQRVPAPRAACSKQRVTSAGTRSPVAASPPRPRPKHQRTGLAAPPPFRLTHASAPPGPGPGSRSRRRARDRRLDVARHCATPTWPESLGSLPDSGPPNPGRQGRGGRRACSTPRSPPFHVEQLTLWTTCAKRPPPRLPESFRRLPPNLRGRPLWTSQPSPASPTASPASP